MIEARIDEPRTFALGWLAPPGNEIEEVFPLFGGLEHESRGQEDRRLDRPFRKLRIEAIAQHQCFGMEAVIADMGLGWPRCGHGVLQVNMSENQSRSPASRSQILPAPGSVGLRRAEALFRQTVAVDQATLD